MSTLLDSAERFARLRLARTNGVGPITFRRLIERYGSAQKAIEWLPELAKRGGRKNPLVAASKNAIETEISKLQKLGAGYIVFGDDTYPAQLAAIDDAPITLSVRGHTSLLQKTGIGIVGARNASIQGRRMATQIAQNLGKADLTIISGLARGIDTAAHEGSLATGTIAVIAGGIDVIYPQENKNLYDQIADMGAIVAENPFGTQPTAQHFPRRNRIISGLSSGIVVVEATLKSGSLITAHMAADQGREVFAVPGHPFDARASGPNSLIRDGATLTSAANDILQALAARAQNRIVREAAPTQNLFAAPEPDEATLSAARADIADLLSTTPIAVDDLIDQSGIAPAIMQALLLELELAGRLQRHPQNRVSALFFDETLDTSAFVL